MADRRRGAGRSRLRSSRRQPAHRGCLLRHPAGLFRLTANTRPTDPCCSPSRSALCDRASLRFVASSRRGSTDPRRLSRGCGPASHPPSRRCWTRSPTDLGARRVPAPLSDAASADLCVPSSVRAEARSGRPVIMRRREPAAPRRVAQDAASGAGAARRAHSTWSATSAHARSPHLLLRLSRLPVDAVRVARAVSVLGDGASMSVVAALTAASRSQRSLTPRRPRPSRDPRLGLSLGFVHPLGAMSSTTTCARRSANGPCNRCRCPEIEALPRSSSPPTSSSSPAGARPGPATCSGRQAGGVWSR